MVIGGVKIRGVSWMLRNELGAQVGFYCWWGFVLSLRGLSAERSQQRARTSESIKYAESINVSCESSILISRSGHLICRFAEEGVPVIFSLLDTFQYVLPSLMQCLLGWKLH